MFGEKFLWLHPRAALYTSLTVSLGSSRQQVEIRAVYERLQCQDKSCWAFLGDTHVQMKSCFKEHQDHPPGEHEMTKGQCADRGSWQKIKGAVPTALIQSQCGKNLRVSWLVFNSSVVPWTSKLWAGVMVLIHSILKTVQNLSVLEWNIGLSYQCLWFIGLF